jgi:hypothetical protein
VKIVVFFDNRKGFLAMPEALVSAALTCPQCHQGRGIPKGVMTVPGNMILVAVVYCCASCRNEWRVLRATVGGFRTDAPHDASAIQSTPPL